MVLNALQVDPNRPWKGIWRWFSEEVLGCTNKDQMAGGMNLEEMTVLARCNGLHTQTFRADNQTTWETTLKAKKIEFISDN